MKSSSRFASMAKEATTLCEIMNGKTKIDTDDLLGKEITVTAFDFIELKDKSGELNEFAVICFKEDPEAFFFAGTVLTKICKAWAKEFDGSAEEASAELASDGGVVIKMTAGKTKNGRRITNVEIL